MTPDDASTPRREAPALLVAGLRFAYPAAGGPAGPSGGAPAAGPVLSIDRFALPRGEQALLRGRSGSGKSTLLHLIAGLLDPNPGNAEAEIRVAGRAIHRLRGHARDAFRGRHVGMVFQAFHLLQGFTALENVAVAMAFSDLPPGEHDERARALLDRLGLADRAHATPDELSLGQQQRVAVARALACSPELVLADEPTASLDPENGRAAVGLMREVCQERGAALLVVSHDPALAGVFERDEDLDELRDRATRETAATA